MCRCVCIQMCVWSGLDIGRDITLLYSPYPVRSGYCLQTVSAGVNNGVVSNCHRPLRPFRPDDGTSIVFRLLPTFRVVRQETWKRSQVRRLHNGRRRFVSESTSFRIYSSSELTVAAGEDTWTIGSGYDIGSGFMAKVGIPPGKSDASGRNTSLL